MAVKRELLVVMKGAPDELLKSLDKAKSSFAKLGSELKSIGSSLTASLTLPIAGAGIAVAKLAGDFEAGMNRVKALTGATGSEFAKLKQLAVDLGASTKFSAGEAAEGMAFLGQAGFKTNEIIAAMPGLLDLAAAGQLDLGRAADIASNVLSGFGLNASEAGRAADVLALAANSSNTSVEQLGTAMSYVAPIAKSVGISMEETAAMIGKLSDAGIQGERAGTALRGAISALLDPGKKAAKVFEELNINVRNSDGSMRPLVDILAEMGAKSKDAGDFVKVFGRESAAAAQVLANAAPEIKSFTAELDGAGGTAKRVAETMQQGLNGALEELGGALETLAIAIADAGLLDWLKGVIQGATEFVRSLGQLNPELLKWGTILAGAAAAIGPIVYLLGTLAGSVSSIAGLLAGTSGLLKGFFGALSAGSGILSALGIAVPGLTGALGGLGTALGAIATGPWGLAIAAAAALGAGYVVLDNQTEQLKKTMADTKEIEQMRDLLHEFGIDVKQQAGESWPEYAKRVKDTANEFLGLEDAATRAQRATDEWRKRFDAANKAIDEGKEAFKKLKIEEENLRNGITQLPGKIKIGADALTGLGFSADEAAKLVGKVAPAADDAGEGVKKGGEKVKTAWEKMLSALFGDPKPEDAFIRLRDAAEGSVGAAPAIDALTTALAQSFTKLQGVLTQALKDTEGSLGAFKNWLDGIVGAVPPAQDAVTSLIQSFEPLDTTLSASATEMFGWEDQLKQAGITSQKVAEEQIAVLAEKLALAQEGYANGTVSLTELKNVTDQYNQALGITTQKSDEFAQLGRQISTIMTDLSKGIADAILGAGSLGEAFVNAAKAIAEAILRTIVEGAMNVLLDSIKNNSNAVQGLIDKFKDFFGLFGGGGGAKVPGVPGGGGGGNQPGGGASPTGGIGGVINVVTGLVQAIASIFQIFQLARIEKDVGRMEVTTREIKAETVNLRADEWSRHTDVIGKWDLAVQALWDIKEAVQNGLKVQTGGAGNISLVVDLPEELRLTLISLRGIAEANMFAISAIRDAVGITLVGEALTQTDLLRTVVSQLEGILLAISGSEKPPVVVKNLNVNAVSSDPRKLAGQIMTEMEKAGSLRSGSLPAFAAG